MKVRGDKMKKKTKVRQLKPTPKTQNFTESTAPLAAQLERVLGVPNNIALIIIGSASRALKAASMPADGPATRTRISTGLPRIRALLKSLPPGHPLPDYDVLFPPPPGARPTPDHVYQAITMSAPDPLCFLTPNECWAGKGSNSTKRMFS